MEIKDILQLCHNIDDARTKLHALAWAIVDYHWDEIECFLSQETRDNYQRLSLANRLQIVTLTNVYPSRRKWRASRRTTMIRNYDKFNICYGEPGRISITGTAPSEIKRLVQKLNNQNCDMVAAKYAVDYQYNNMVRKGLI